MEERICTPDMSPFDRFRFGDAVAHFSRGDGRVTGNDGKKIVVQFQRGGDGIYDANWFKVNPRLLYHRNVQPLTHVGPA